MFLVLQRSATLTGPSPATWAPTSTTRLSKTLSPGSSLDKSEESRLTLLPSSYNQTPSCLCLIPPESQRERANQLLLLVPLFSFFLDVSCGCAKINHLNFLHCVDWYVTTVKLLFSTQNMQADNEPIMQWSQQHYHNHSPKFKFQHCGPTDTVYILRSESAFSRRHVDGSFTSDVNKVLDSMAAKEYLLWVMTSKPSGER